MAFRALSGQLPGESKTLQRLAVKLAMRFAGEPQPDEVLDNILQEAEANKRVNDSANQRQDAKDNQDKDGNQP